MKIYAGVVVNIVSGQNFDIYFNTAKNKKEAISTMALSDERKQLLKEGKGKMFLKCLGKYKPYVEV